MAGFGAESREHAAVEVDDVNVGRLPVGSAQSDGQAVPAGERPNGDEVGGLSEDLDEVPAAVEARQPRGLDEAPTRVCDGAVRPYREGCGAEAVRDEAGLAGQRALRGVEGLGHQVRTADEQQMTPSGLTPIQELRDPSGRGVGL